MGDTLTTNRTISMFNRNVSFGSNGGSLTGIVNIPDVHILNLFTDLNASHTLDALA